jgi:DNA-binding GntR family transcriptional regulator
MLDSASPFAAIVPPGAESMNTLAFKRLRQAVIVLELLPGSIVGENELAERYRLGRSSVRVALTRLASAGLVEARARHGWRIVPVTGLFVGELIAARQCLEPSLANIRLSPKEGDRLNTLTAMNQALRGQDGPALATARINDRQILDLLAQHLDTLRRRWLGEAWDHSDRVAALLDKASGFRWPHDRGVLLSALLRGDAITARREIKGDIADFEVHAANAVFHLPMPFSAHHHRGERHRTQLRAPRGPHIKSQQEKTR